MDMQSNDKSQQDKQQTPQPEFAIQRIYIKDLSFEAPNVPAMFKDEWKPEVKFNLQTESQEVDQGVYEVILFLTVTVNNNAANQTKAVYVIEVKHAGIFTIKNFQKDQLQQVIGSICPAIIYPYAREVISDIVVRGSFPPLYLAPINFDALYAESLKHKQTETASNETKQ